MVTLSVSRRLFIRSQVSLTGEFSGHDFVLLVLIDWKEKIEKIEKKLVRTVSSFCHTAWMRTGTHYMQL